MSDFFTSFFWFGAPQLSLTGADKLLGYIFLGVFFAAVIFFVLTKLARNPIDKSMLKKVWRMAFVTGFSGMLWYGVRYQNTPIFGNRFWAGIVLLIGLIWLLYLIYYFIKPYRVKKQEFEKESIKNKYLPRSK